MQTITRDKKIQTTVFVVNASFKNIQVKNEKLIVPKQNVKILTGQT
jgi:hypothetical protein